ncbi:MAG: MEMO1 family protein [Methermicoccaceae archaeon]
MRRPAAAGRYYPKGKEALLLELKRCFEGLTIAQDLSIKGVVCPHAGYMYSGRTAAYSYALIPEAQTYVIFCPNHTGMGTAVSLSTEQWATPLGAVDVDMEFVKGLSMRTIEMDERAHQYEHAIELQLPFLQYRFGDAFKIVPICLGMQDETTAAEVGADVREAMESAEGRVVVIASSDFTHYEPVEVATNNDHYVIDALLRADVSEFYRRRAERMVSVCGYGAIGSMLYSVQPESGELLNYSTSGDTTRDYAAVVGYAAIAMR